MPEYFELERTQRMLNAAADVSEDLLNGLGASASTEMRNFLLSLTENPPTGDDINDEIYNAVSYEVVARYLATVSDYEGYRSWKAEAQSARDSIQTGINLNVRSNIITARGFGRGDV